MDVFVKRITELDKFKSDTYSFFHVNFRNDNFQIFVNLPIITRYWPKQHAEFEFTACQSSHAAHADVFLFRSITAEDRELLDAFPSL